MTGKTLSSTVLSLFFVFPAGRFIPSHRPKVTKSDDICNILDDLLGSSGGLCASGSRLSLRVEGTTLRRVALLSHGRWRRTLRHFSQFSAGREENFKTVSSSSGRRGGRTLRQFPPFSGRSGGRTLRHFLPFCGWERKNFKTLSLLLGQEQEKNLRHFPPSLGQPEENFKTLSPSDRRRDSAQRCIPPRACRHQQ